MVKGVNRQVLLVKPPEPKLFEQAIFILRDDLPTDGITDEMLLKEAKVAATAPLIGRKLACGPLWACCGGAFVALIWLLSACF